VKERLVSHLRALSPISRFSISVSGCVLMRTGSGRYPIS